MCPACGALVQNHGGNKKLWIIGACVLIVLLAAVLCATVLRGAQKEPAEQPTESTNPSSEQPKENTVYYKGSYTVEADEANALRDQVVATVDGEELTNGRLQVFYWNQIIDFLNRYGSVAIYYGLDYTQPLDAQTFDDETGLTWQQYFLENALNAWMQYTLLAKKAEADQFELPEEYADYLDKLEETLGEQAESEGYASAEELIQGDMGASCTLEDYRNYLRVYYIANLYFTQLVEEMDITAEELEAYFTENEENLSAQGITKDSGKLIDVRHILLIPEGEDGATTYSDEEWEACRVKAQELLDQWLAGEHTEESFAALAGEKSEDPGSKDNGGLYDYVAEGDMVEPFEDWCFDESRQEGDYGLVKTSYGYHIMYYVGGDEGWIRLCESGVRGEKASTLLEELTGGMTLEADYTAMVLGPFTFGQTATE